jgi:hypothetical protein
LPVALVAVLIEEEAAAVAVTELPLVQVVEDQAQNQA